MFPIIAMVTVNKSDGTLRSCKEDGFSGREARVSSYGERGSFIV
jgi:hypothetical protein